MILLKCKMCGGDIDANLEQTIGTCDSCGSTMTLPKVSDERIANLYNRANHSKILIIWIMICKVDSLENLLIEFVQPHF